MLSVDLNSKKQKTLIDSQEKNNLPPVCFGTPDSQTVQKMLKV